MPSADESDSQNTNRPENRESERRIATAIVDLLQPQLNAIAERLDGQVIATDEV